MTTDQTSQTTRPDQAAKARAFLDLHVPGRPLLLANVWDVGSARIVAGLGYRALATTSSGHAASLGRLDHGVSRQQTLDHATDIVGATDLPVSADTENGFGDSPDEVADLITAALATGLAGCSIEDSTGRPDRPIYELGAAAERVAAAAAAAHAGPVPFVLTARAENYLHGRPDLADTIARLRAFQEAGADVLYAPGLDRLEDIRAVVEAVERPVNVLALPSAPTVAELAGVGVARISVGGAFAFAAYGALAQAATELRDAGTYGFRGLSGIGSKAVTAGLSVAPDGARRAQPSGSS